MGIRRLSFGTTWLEDVERYKIQNHNDSAYLNNEGTLTDRTYSKARSSFYLYTLVGGEELECFVQTPERYGSYYWETDGETLVCDQAEQDAFRLPIRIGKGDWQRRRNRYFRDCGARCGIYGGRDTFRDYGYVRECGRYDGLHDGR